MMSKTLPRDAGVIGPAFVHVYGSTSKARLQELDGLRAIPTVVESVWGWQRRPPSWATDKHGLLGAPGFHVYAPRSFQGLGARRTLPFSRAPPCLSAQQRSWMVLRLRALGSQWAMGLDTLPPGFLPSAPITTVDVSDESLTSNYFAAVGPFILAHSGSSPAMVPEAPSTVHIFCTGASRGEEAPDRTKWLIKCTPQCYGPTGCLMELAHGDALERPARLSMAGRHVSLLLSPSPVQRLAASLFGGQRPRWPCRDGGLS